MTGGASVDLIDVTFGRFPEVEPLNPSFRRGALKVKATLQIDWKPQDPIHALGAIQKRLYEMLPTYEHHECRGPREYHVHTQVLGTAVSTRAANRDRSEAQDSLAAPQEPQTILAAPLGADVKVPEPGVALAHTIEHVMIDSIAFVTGKRIVSGLTAALRNPEDTCEVFVECDDPRLGRLAVQLALDCIVPVLDGAATGHLLRPVLELARRFLRGRGFPIKASVAAHELNRRPDEIQAALGLLERAGFIRRIPFTKNFGLEPQYALSSREGALHHP